MKQYTHTQGLVNLLSRAIELGKAIKNQSKSHLFSNLMEISLSINLRRVCVFLLFQNCVKFISEKMKSVG